MAYLQDTFTRANQSGWGTASGGGSWNNVTAGSGFSWDISSNTGEIKGNFNGSLEAYIGIASQNNLSITGSFTTSGQFTLSGGRTEDIFVVVRMDGTQGTGYGMRFNGNSGSSNLQVTDNGSTLASANFTVVNSTTYFYQIDIDANNWANIYVWTASKPGSPSVSWNNSGSPYTPTATGSNFGIQYSPNQAGTGTVVFFTTTVDIPTLSPSVTDSSAISDTATITEKLLISKTDSSAISDTPTMQINYPILVSETVTVTDRPTIYYYWVNAARDASSWSTGTEHSSIWTDATIDSSTWTNSTRS